MKAKLFNLLPILVWFVINSLTINSAGLVTSAWSQERSVHQSRLIDQDMERAAARIYKNALKSYNEQAYWKTARELIILLDYYPTFSEVDGVLYHLGESFYEMAMYKTAAQMFRFLVTKYTASKYLPHALYGLQRINYQTEDYSESLKFFSAITSRFAEAEIIDGARYYAGMAYYHQRDYDNTISTMSKIRARSDYLEHGLYTVGLAYLKKKWSIKPSMPYANS
ncbi:MAG: tetratricopeptide repeat protein [candidate division KSB1 bacterium]|nr:tetratricopeptide repeat protein [candidate division KSB1 bacterium]